MRRAVIAAAIAMELLLAGVLVVLLRVRPAEKPRPRTASVRAGVIAPARSEPATGTPRSWLPTVFRYDFPQLRRDPEPRSYAHLIAEASARRALPQELITAIIRVESDFDPRTVSHKGARGLMQVMPATGERFGVARHELFDPRRNIDAGTAYLAWLRDRYHGDVDRILAAYNAGEGAVDRYGGIPPYRETQQYVRRVRAALGGRNMIPE